MKLSKTTSIAIASASAVVYGFGVLAVQAKAQTTEYDIVSPEVSLQIQEALGDPDSDELLVDALTQVEGQLKEYGVKAFAPDGEDTPDIAELKRLRRSYIQQLRERMQELDGTERGEFRQKIRDRRQEVRKEVLELRKERLAERKAERIEQREASQKEMEERREKFKENLESRLDAAKERQKSAEVKFKDRIDRRQERIEELEKESEASQAMRDRLNAEKREQVKGAIDYQPNNIFERIGFWLTGH